MQVMLTGTSESTTSSLFNLEMEIKLSLLMMMVQLQEEFMLASLLKMTVIVMYFQQI